MIFGIGVYAPRFGSAACLCKIGRLIATAVLLWNDMLEVEAEERLVLWHKSGNTRVDYATRVHSRDCRQRRSL